MFERSEECFRVNRMVFQALGDPGALSSPPRAEVNRGEPMPVGQKLNAELMAVDSVRALQRAREHDGSPALNAGRSGGDRSQW